MKRRKWTPTSLTYTTDYDISKLKKVYVNDVEFVRAEGRKSEPKVTRKG